MRRSLDPCLRTAYTAGTDMHPVMFTIPGWGFKIIVPLLVLWGMYSIVVSANRASPSKATAKKGDDGDEKKGFELPADNPTNALISIGIGLGVFAFSAPVTLTGTNVQKFIQVLKGFVNGRNWFGAHWESLPIYSYGVMLGLSFVVGWYLTLALTDRQKLNRQDMGDAYVFTAFSAVIGSRVLYILTNLSEFPTLESMLRLRSGGLVAYGGFLGGLLGSIIFLTRRGYRLWPWADAVVPSLGTGLMITRIGCYLYGCDFGKPLSPNAPGFLKRLGTFPHWHDNHGSPAWQQHVRLGFRATREVCERSYNGFFNSTDGLCHIPVSAHHSVPVHPTQIYESTMGFTIFLVLMFLWKRRRFEGQIFLAFGVLYGVGRALLEIIRDDAERGVVAGMSTSMFLGIVTSILSAALYVYRMKTQPLAVSASLFDPVPGDDAVAPALAKAKDVAVKAEAKAEAKADVSPPETSREEAAEKAEKP